MKRFEIDYDDLGPFDVHKEYIQCHEDFFYKTRKNSVFVLSIYKNENSKLENNNFSISDSRGCCVTGKTLKEAFDSWFETRCGQIELDFEGIWYLTPEVEERLVG
jgi:hypothetical protein